MTIFFISDTHFSHANFLKFTDDEGDKIRDFPDVETMDEHMVECWNSVVRLGDKVYHLGDVTFDLKKFRTILPRLNGRKRLLVGNHDQVKELCPFFEKVQLWRIFKDENFVATHVPIPVDQFRHKVQVNVHGHIHQNVKEGPYINVCVEPMDYTPISMDELQTMIKDTVSTNYPLT